MNQVGENKDFFFQTEKLKYFRFVSDNVKKSVVLLIIFFKTKLETLSFVSVIGLYCFE